MTVPVDSLVHRFEWDRDLEVLVKKVLVQKAKMLALEVTRR